MPSPQLRQYSKLAAQKVPLPFCGPGRGIRPGRKEIESVNRPMVIGGALVVPAT